MMFDSADTSCSLSSSPDEQCSSHRPARLQIWLSILSAVAAFACMRALLLPPWPHAEILRPERIQSVLSRAGLDPRPLRSQPMIQAEGLGFSSLLAWRLPDASEVSLAFVHVRRRDDFQVAWITRDVPQLSLRQRRLDDPQPGVVSGTIHGRAVYQTCLVMQGAEPAVPGVTARSLAAAVDRQPRTAFDALRSLAGFSRNRELRCLLVTLQSPTAQSPQVQTWHMLFSTLREFSLTEAHLSHVGN